MSNGEPWWLQPCLDKVQNVLSGEGEPLDPDRSSATFTAG